MAFSPLDLISRTAGGALAGATGALGAARQRTKPLHPEGQIRRATVTRTGSPVRAGVPWLDDTGRDDALVRVSRGIGLPDRLPDIHGLALRLDGPERGDVLFASTGLGRLTRFVLLPSATPHSRPLTTLLPYRAPRGGLVLAAVPDSERTFELHWAGPVGPWHRFGRLELGEPLGDDTRVSFDPVLHVPAGLQQYGWVKRLREPAYWTARARSGRA
ncbi:MAG: hypothetical protein ACXV2J_15665 [Actinomycetes bacterium]